jgi:hypothetical protein
MVGGWRWGPLKNSLHPAAHPRLPRPRLHNVYILGRCVGCVGRAGGRGIDVAGGRGTEAAPPWRPLAHQGHQEGGGDLRQGPGVRSGLFRPSCAFLRARDRRAWGGWVVPPARGPGRPSGGPRAASFASTHPTSITRRNHRQSHQPHRHRHHSACSVPAQSRRDFITQTVSPPVENALSRHECKRNVSGGMACSAAIPARAHRRPPPPVVRVRGGKHPFGTR